MNSACNTLKLKISKTFSLCGLRRCVLIFGCLECLRRWRRVLIMAPCCCNPPNDSIKQNFKDLSMFPTKRFCDDISAAIEALHDFQLADHCWSNKDAQLAVFKGAMKHSSMFLMTSTCFWTCIFKQMLSHLTRRRGNNVVTERDCYGSDACEEKVAPII